MALTVHPKTFIACETCGNIDHGENPLIPMPLAPPNGDEYFSGETVADAVAAFEGFKSRCYARNNNFTGSNLTFWSGGIWYNRVEIAYISWNNRVWLIADGNPEVNLGMPLKELYQLYDESGAVARSFDGETRSPLGLTDGRYNK